MRKLTLTILLVVAVAATWAQKLDRKTAKLEKRYDGPVPADRLPGDCGAEEIKRNL